MEHAGGLVGVRGPWSGVADTRNEEAGSAKGAKIELNPLLSLGYGAPVCVATLEAGLDEAREECAAGRARVCAR